MTHQRSTPLWPQANSEAENFMRPLNKAIRAAHTEGKNWKSEIYSFLLNYRATPHSTTEKAPAELLFNRQIRTKLPQIINETEDIEIREKDKKEKEKMKDYSDKKRHAKPSYIKVGDMILIRQNKASKLSTRFDPNPFTVVKRKGTMITATRNGKYLTRNISLCKKVKGRPQKDNSNDSEIEDLYGDDDSNTNQGQNEPPTLQCENQRRYPVRNRQQVRRYGQNIYEY